MKTIALFQTLLLVAAITPSAGALTDQPAPLTHVHPQFGPIGGMGAAKLLKEFHLPGSPNELFQFLLEYFLKQKLGNTLPLNLDANHAYPTVENAQLPGGPFQGKPVAPTVRNFHTALAPGDYVVPVMAYCTQYSVHRAGQGTAYKLAPVEGTQAEAISTLLWRGTLAGRSPQDLQATNWAIQAGVPYGSMPKPYQALIDQLIPDYRNKLKGNMLDIVQTTYKDVTTDPRRFLQTYIEEKYNTNVPLMILPRIAVPAPPLEVLLAKMGPAGQMVLDARKQSTILLTAYTTKQLGEQTLFQGQGEQLPPEPAGEGPWTVRVPGQAYLRFIVKSGNMHGDNLMQIRILPNSATAAADAADSKPRLMLTGYQVTPTSSSPATAPSAVAATSVYGLLGVKSVGDPASGAGTQALTSSGVIGYSVGGGGAQALVPVAAGSSNPTLIATPQQHIPTRDTHGIQIGIGEIVSVALDGGTATNWTVTPASAGVLSQQGASSVVFTAFDQAVKATIQAQAGSDSPAVVLDIIRPSTLSWVPLLPQAVDTVEPLPILGNPTLHPNNPTDASDSCQVGALGYYFFGPERVSFSRVRFREQNVRANGTGIFSTYKPSHCGSPSENGGWCKADGISSSVVKELGSRAINTDHAWYSPVALNPYHACSRTSSGRLIHAMQVQFGALKPTLSLSQGDPTSQLHDDDQWSSWSLLTVITQYLSAEGGLLQVHKGATPPGAPLPTVRSSDPTNFIACTSPSGDHVVYGAPPDLTAILRSSTTDLKPCRDFQLYGHSVLPSTSPE